MTPQFRSEAATRLREDGIAIRLFSCSGAIKTPHRKMRGSLIWMFDQTRYSCPKLAQAVMLGISPLTQNLVGAALIVLVVILAARWGLRRLARVIFEDA